MNAAAPQFGATGLVHLRDKDIHSSVTRKFSGLPDEAPRWFREFSTFMDKHDLGPYKDNTVSVLINDFRVISDPQEQPDVPHTGWLGPSGPPPPFYTSRTASATTASAPLNADAMRMDDLAVNDDEMQAEVSAVLEQANIANSEQQEDTDSNAPTGTTADAPADGDSLPSGSGSAAASSAAVSLKQTATPAPLPAPPPSRHGALPSLFAPHPPAADSTPGAFARSSDGFTRVTRPSADQTATPESLDALFSNEQEGLRHMERHNRRLHLYQDHLVLCYPPPPELYSYMYEITADGNVALNVHVAKQGVPDSFGNTNATGLPDAMLYHVSNQ